jgi:hypothetical protein
MKNKHEDTTVEELYVTKDQQLASLIYATGHVLDSSYWENGSCYFVFENKKECDQLVSKYYNGLLKINAKSIFDALNTVRSIIYSR